MKVSRAASLIAVVAFVATACNPDTAADREGGELRGEIPPGAASGTLTIWGFGTDDAIGSSRLEAFEQEYPDVRVKLTPGDFDNQKFLSALAAGDPPDLIYISRDEIGSFAARGALSPLDDAIETAGLDTGVFYDAAIEPLRYQDATYGLPEFNNVIVAYMNDPALRDAGIDPADVDFSDWDQLRQIDERLSRMSGDTVQRVGFDPKLPEFLPLWARANGGSILSDDGTQVTLDEEPVAAALDYGSELRGAYGGESAYDAFSQSWDIFGSGNPFVKDQVGITLYEQWYLGVLAEVSPDVDITVAPFTTNDGGEPVTWATGNAWAIPAEAANPEAAFAWMAFMTSTDTWVAAAEASKRQAERDDLIYTGTFTGNREADQRTFDEVYEPSGNASFDQAVEVILGVQDASFSIPANPAGAELLQAYTEAADQALLGKVDAAEAMDRADAEAQQAIDQAATE